MKTALLLTFTLLISQSWTEGIDNTIVITGGGDDLNFMDNSKCASSPLTP